MTTVPFMPMVEIITRMALTATPSAPFLSPRPTQRPAAMAAASVTRTSSSARLRSGASARTSSAAGIDVPRDTSFAIGLPPGLVRRQPLSGAVQPHPADLRQDLALFPERE